jgi:RHS repeat-associated protein
VRGSSNASSRVANPTHGTAPRFRFTSYDRDEAHNDYAILRFDSNRLGRFLQADVLHGSIANPQSLNRFSYVLNNPVNFIDPLGLQCIDGVWNEKGSDRHGRGGGGGGGGNGAAQPQVQGRCSTGFGVGVIGGATAVPGPAHLQEQLLPEESALDCLAISYRRFRAVRLRVGVPGPMLSAGI